MFLYNETILATEIKLPRCVTIKAFTYDLGANCWKLQWFANKLSSISIIIAFGYYN